mmetsp:Transcript_45725/g.97486  ORF Transcript_45725/g.97486 Transcript_45725/m.97486 type:complete len:256 (+) Transcript_45725:936-1703(+)
MQQDDIDMATRADWTGGSSNVVCDGKGGVVPQHQVLSAPLLGRRVHLCDRMCGRPPTCKGHPRIGPMYGLVRAPRRYVRRQAESGRGLGTVLCTYVKDEVAVGSTHSTAVRAVVGEVSAARVELHDLLPQCVTKRGHIHRSNPASVSVQHVRSNGLVQPPAVRVHSQQKDQVSSAQHILPPALGHPDGVGGRAVTAHRREKGHAFAGWALSTGGTVSDDTSNTRSEWPVIPKGPHRLLRVERGPIGEAHCAHRAG